MIGVHVREEDVVYREAGSVAHHLPLRAFAAVEHHQLTRPCNHERRNVASLMIARAGELLMFDCGEGTQRQMMRYGTGFTVNDIFFTHMHADHFLGVIGLLRTMGLQGREEAMHLWGPEGAGEILHEAVHLGVERVPFEIVIHEIAADTRIPRTDYDIVAYRTQHGIRSLGYALIEHERLGRFHAERARELGVPEGPLFGKLHRGESIEVNGRTITASD